MTLAAGRTLAHYTILGPLGAGAMGEVYRAKDSRLGREVAIKVLPEHFADDVERLKRFEREATTLASLNHPNVAQIYGVDQVGDTCFLVLELVPGESLFDHLLRGPMPVPEAIEACRQIAEGLAAAHDAGVIHRDLKPANVRLTPDGKIKVLDFGLAKPARESGGSASSTDSVLSTEAGRLLGTPTYMAPEQARGKPIDERVDVWAFGCVLFECLTGGRAFAGETLTDVFAAVIEREPDWNRLPATLPASVRELLRQCLAKDPARRRRDVRDIALGLQSALDRPDGVSANVAATARRGSILPWLVAAAALAIGIVGAWPRGTKERGGAPEANTVRFSIPLPADASLGMNDRMMNEIAVSPDGSTIVYVVEEGESVRFYARDLSQPTARRLDLEKNPRGPTFSPDGAWLAYVEDFKFLVRVPIAGGPVERLAETGGSNGSAAWLADGRIVLAKRNGRELSEIDVATGTQRTITETSGEFTGFETVAAGPDPRWILADGWKGLGVADYRVMAVDRESGAVEVLLENASNPVLVGKDILVFQRGAALFAARLDLERRRVVGEARLVLPGVATDRWGGNSQFAVSADGTLVYAPGRRRGEGRRIEWVDATGNVTPIRPEPDAFVEGLELSRDESRLLVRTLRQHEELWVYDLVGRGMTPLATGELGLSRFDAAGERVYYSVNLGRTTEVRCLPVAGGTPTTVIVGFLEPTCLTSDGRTLLAHGRFDRAPGDPEHVYRVDLTAQPPRAEPWIASGKDDVSARLSPDEKWMAYASNRSGQWEVYVRAWPDGERDWKVSAGEGGLPCWAPEGNTLYYLDDVRLMAVDLSFPGASDGSGEPRIAVGAVRETLRDLAFAEVQSFSVGRGGRIARVNLAAWEREVGRLEVVVGWSGELERTLAPRR